MRASALNQVRQVAGLDLAGSLVREKVGFLDPDDPTDPVARQLALVDQSVNRLGYHPEPGRRIADPEPDRCSRLVCRQLVRGAWPLIHLNDPRAFSIPSPVVYS